MEIDVSAGRGKMRAALEEVEEELREKPFSSVRVAGDFEQAGHDAHGYLAEVEGGWSYVLCSFDVSDQGFPRGTRGHDGTARKGGIVLRLTRRLARLAYRKAHEQERREKSP